MELLLLCWEFFKTGLFAVGGGMATIPFLTEMSANYPHWFSLSTLADMIAVSESTPGPIGVNMATYAGFLVAGPFGALLATLSLVLPSLIVLLIIARMLQSFQQNAYVQAVFLGLRPAVTGLIGAAGYSVLLLALFQNGLFSFINTGIFLVFFALMQMKKLKNIHPAAYIALSAIIGVAFQL